MKKLNLKSKLKKKPTDPLEVFKHLTLRGSVENVWDTQAEALRRWHKDHRSSPDCIIEMSTGGGKTLVGLLIAQSIANEETGRVLYVCGNNQLVEQTAGKADEVGLRPARRYRGAWHDETEFQRSRTFCITNYATVFNGKSIFRDEPVSSIIFDDSHLADGEIRKCFSLSIPRSHTAYRAISDLLRQPLAGTHQAVRLDALENGEARQVVFVPTFASYQKADEIRFQLRRCGVTADQNLLFAWEHLQQHLQHCAFTFGVSGLEITPPCIPHDSVPCFTSASHRIYLTATLPSQSSFYRAFGRRDAPTISPKGKSGDAQRLFIFAEGESDDDQREFASSLVKERKCCIISPSKDSAQAWEPVSKIYETASGQAEIDRFIDSDLPEKLTLVARYDGIDLPGKSCNMLILDGLPRGETNLGRFLDERLKADTLRTAQAATRITQAIGRIFRSNTDHGVVIVVGSTLKNWLRLPAHQAFLPPRLQQQINLSQTIEEQVSEGEASYSELIEAVLSGDPNWDETYNHYIDEHKSSDQPNPDEGLASLIGDESAAFSKLWSGDGVQASSGYATVAAESETIDQFLSAWHRHWQGCSELHQQDRSGAYFSFMKAAATRIELGRPSDQVLPLLQPKGNHGVSSQSQKMHELRNTNKSGFSKRLKKVAEDLKYEASVNRVEEAVAELGRLLGLDSRRPDSEIGKGPDVMWSSGEGLITCGFELKTDKDKDSIYTKDEIGQCYNHLQWVRLQAGEASKVAIVGRALDVSAKADPDPALEIIPLDFFVDVLSRLKEVHTALESAEPPVTPEVVEAWMKQFGLKWPMLLKAANGSLAAHMQV